jgi:hypothetical protein
MSSAAAAAAGFGGSGHSSGNFMPGVSFSVAVCVWRLAARIGVAEPSVQPGLGADMVPAPRAVCLQCTAAAAADKASCAGACVQASVVLLHCCHDAGPVCLQQHLHAT